MGRNDSTVVQTAVVAPVSVASRPILKQTPIEPEASETQPSPAVVESTATFEPEENAPRKKSLLDAPLVHSNSDAKGKIGKPSLSGGIGPIVSIFVSLFIVITTFLLLAMLFKKVSPKGIRALPKELFENLGRAPLTQKHQLNLLRLGNRLLLVSVTLDGVQPITEITDPDEVVQLLGLCRRQDANSSTQNFKKMFSNLAEEPAEGGYFGADVETRPKPKVKTVPKTKASLVDLYSDPDESLTELLANGLKGGRNG